MLGAQSAPSFLPASALSSSAPQCPPPQQLIERRPHDSLVQHSPYGPSRNTTYGWGNPFRPPMTATVPSHPCIHIGISSLNGVPTVGQSDRSMRSLLTQYRKKFNCLEHCYPYHKVGDEGTWKTWADMVRNSNAADGGRIHSLKTVSAPPLHTVEGAAAADVASAGATPLCPLTVNANRFLYTIKANNLLTHVKQLQMDDADVLAHVQVFFQERCPLLEPFLGPVLVQLPPSFGYSPENVQRLTRLHQLLSQEEVLLLETRSVSPKAFSSSGTSSTTAPSSSAPRRQRRLRVAVEFRSRSWYRDETFALLRSFRWALVVAHHHDDPTYSQVVDTGAGFLYVRLHGPLGRNVGDYGPLAMRLWAEKMVQYLRSERSPAEGSPTSALPDETTREVFIFLNNSDSNVGGTTSSVVDATCLAEQMRNLLQCKSSRPPPAETAAASPSPRVSADPQLVMARVEAKTPMAVPEDDCRASCAQHVQDEADTPPPKRQCTAQRSSGTREDEVVID
ncbi:Protein of unknown function DUF72, putative [Leishmania donovani]|uniref:Uncharacterized protein n=1 Tax=Leishmania donovani TaxID=5661 RepID=A0A3Q8IG26_LEIDO|nr:Protein of unknown function DUF72, putative [Leishmania donovani]